MRVVLNETERKPLAALLDEYMNTKPQYLRTPSYGYRIGDLLLTREGDVEGPDTMSQTEFDELLAILNVSGYCPKKIDFHPAQRSEAKTTSIGRAGLTITIPLESVNIENFASLPDVKGFLIKHVLHIDDLRLELSEDNTSFPRFSELPKPDEAHTYSTLTITLCEMSKNQKRISAAGKPVDNERYASRCFLLRLGSTGDECETDHEILIRHLPDSSAFKGGEDHAISR